MIDPDRGEAGERVRVVTLDVSVCNADTISDAVAVMVGRGSGGYVCFSTVHMVMESHDNPDYAAKVNAANIVIPDGMPLVWMQKLLGQRNAKRTRANDMMIRLCRDAAERGWPVGFYGATELVMDSIKERAAREFPKLNIVYAYSPPFRALTSDEKAAIGDEISANDPALLFVGLGCPKQELWMAEHSPGHNAVMFGVGASFDFFAGNVRESPPWLGKLGLEWLFRLAHEPRRLWYRYLVLNPRFIWLALRQLTSRQRAV